MIGVIYALCDPTTNEPRYVGKTVQPLRERFARHMRQAANGTLTHKCHWLRSLTSSPVVRVLEADISRGDLDEAEREWIAYGREQGWRLTNGTDGGDGGLGRYPTEETRKKMSAAGAGRPKSAAHRAAISSARKGYKRTQESIAKQMATRKERSGTYAKPTPEAIASRAAGIRRRHAEDPGYRERVQAGIRRGRALREQVSE